MAFIESMLGGNGIFGGVERGIGEAGAVDFWLYDKWRNRNKILQEAKKTPSD